MAATSDGSDASSDFEQGLRHWDRQPPGERDGPLPLVSDVLDRPEESERLGPELEAPAFADEQQHLGTLLAVVDVALDCRLSRRLT